MRSRPDSQALLRALPLAVAPVFLLIAAWVRRWVCDDAYINFRIVANFVDGHGPVYNVGERVEAGTSTLWLAVLALMEVLPTGVDIATWSVVLGIVSAVGGVVAAQLGALRLMRNEKSRWAVPLGGLIVVALPPMWDFTTSGLENGLSFGWIGLSFWLTARLVTSPFGTKALLFSCVTVGLGPLVRPDLALLAVGFSLAIAVAIWGGPKRRLVMSAVAVAAIPVAYQVFRMGYYGALGPNTALAKEASLTHFELGLNYLKDFTKPYWLWVPLALASFVGLLALPTIKERRRQIVLVVPVVFGVLHCAYVVKVGGDYMHGRMLLPSLFAISAPVMAVWVNRRMVLATSACVLVWAIVCTSVLRTPYRGYNGVAAYSDERNYYLNVAGGPTGPAVANPITTEDYRRATWLRWGENIRAISNGPERLFLYQDLDGTGFQDQRPLAPEVPARVVVIMANIGLYGYTAGDKATIADPAGLGDPVASRLELTKRGRPGHEKGLHPDWFRARYADPATLAAPREQAAYRALQCGEIKGVVDATTKPLDAGQFFTNMRNALHLWEVRIPNDPNEAERRFCR